MKDHFNRIDAKVNQVVLFVITIIAILLVPIGLFLSAAKPKKPTVLFRKQGAIVSCELKGNDNCGRTLKCSDGTTVYCATNLEVVE